MPESGSLQTIYEVSLLTANLQIDSARSGNPNLMSFRGVLTRVDEPSDAPPNGSQGHRIFIPSDVAKKRLNTLKGMAINSSPEWNKHEQQRKIGVIEDAWIEGHNLWVSGNIWAHDFKDVVAELKSRTDLGMSVELSNVRVADGDSDIWKLDDFLFLGGTILEKNAAAYHNTLAIAAAKERMETTTMAKEKAIAAGENTDNAAACACVTKTEAEGIAKAAISAELADLRDAQAETTKILASLAASLETLTASRATSDVEEEDLTAKKKAAKDDDNDEDSEPDGDDDDEMDSEVDKGDLDDMGEGADDEEEGGSTPGDLNKDTKNKGDKSSHSTKVGKQVSKAITGARRKMQAAEFTRIAEENRALRAKLEKMEANQKSMKQQIEAASSRVERKSVALPHELRGLLVKNNVDVQEMTASGSRMSVDEFDGMLSAQGVQDPKLRITLKNMMTRAGLMEEGIIDRSPRQYR